MGVEPTRDSLMPPNGFEVQLQAQSFKQLLNTFLESRRQGLSLRTIDTYRCYLNRAKPVVGIIVHGKQIRKFLDSLQCSNGGRHAYYKKRRTQVELAILKGYG